MKTFITLLCACAVALLTFAQDAATKAPPPPAKASVAAATATIPVSAAVLSAPFVLKDGAISQPATTEVSAGGKAVLTFTVPKAGSYLIHAVANAPDEESNSFFLNIDAQPEDPLMIWDIEVTKGFEDRVVCWRGNGDSAAPDFVPKRFNLTAGEHKLIIVGREPALLKSVSIRPAAN
jgi:hypothetical protein